MTDGPEGSRVFTARIPIEDYEALRAFAAVAGRSMNEVLLRALRSFLRTEGRDDRLVAMLDETRARVRATLDKLVEEEDQEYSGG